MNQKEKGVRGEINLGAIDFKKMKEEAQKEVKRLREEANSALLDAEDKVRQRVRLAMSLIIHKIDEVDYSIRLRLSSGSTPYDQIPSLEEARNLLQQALTILLKHA